MQLDLLYGTAAVLGRSGFLSVLRDLGKGEYYRSSVDLAAMELGPDQIGRAHV